MTGLTAIQEALGPALEDARGIIAERWLITAALAEATFLVILDVLATWHNSNAANWLALAGIWVGQLFCYESVMRRLMSADFRLTPPLVLRLIAFTLVTYSSIVLLVFPFILVTVVIPMPAALKTFVFLSAAYVLTLIVGTTLAFAVLSLDSWGVFASCARSWELTGKRTFWPTFLVTAPYWILWFVVASALTALRQVASPLVLFAVKVPVEFAIALMSASFTYSILARWMAWCEKLFIEA